MKKKIPVLLDRWTLLFSILFGVGLFVAGLFVLWILQPMPDTTLSVPVMTIVFKPVDGAGEELDNESEIEQSMTPTTISVDGIRIGTVVQITGTGGVGLRLRSEPGISSPVQFVGDELELFEVSDGPFEADSYLWWYLESPYDAARSGWAASLYLSVISEEQGGN